MTERTPAKVAVIGAGGIAARHIGNLANMPDATVVGVADLALDRAREQAARVKAAAFDDWRRMLETCRPDAIIICVPPFGHGEPELASAELGIPFFVEKPLAADLENAERIAGVVAQSELITAVGYHWRYLDIVERARDLLQDRPAHLAIGYWLDSVPPRDWWVRQALSGGQLVEQATHIVDLSRHLIGEIVSVSGIAMRAERSEPHGGDVADAYVATATFETGAIATFASASLTRWPHRIGLHTVSEAMVLEISEFELMVDVGKGRPLTHATGDPFVAEMVDFLGAVTGGVNRIRVPYAEALKTHRAAVAATSSAEDGGRVITIDSRA